MKRNLMKKSAMNRRKQQLRVNGSLVEHGIGATPAGAMYLAFLAPVIEGGLIYNSRPAHQQSAHQRRRRHLVRTGYGRRA